MYMHLTERRAVKQRAILEQRRDTLRGRIHAKLQQASCEPYADVIGRVHDVGEESVGRLLLDLDYLTIEHEIHKLPLIEQALDRIDHDSYGFCVDCGVEIPFERLQVQPTAKRCVTCQTKLEHELRPRSPRHPTM